MMVNKKILLFQGWFNNFKISGKYLRVKFSQLEAPKSESRELELWSDCPIGCLIGGHSLGGSCDDQR